MKKRNIVRTVVSFQNTTQALAMEAACKAHGIPGRIIPVPNQITAGCGFSWCAPKEDRERIEHFITEQQLTYSQIYTIEIRDFPAEHEQGNGKD
ncbi:MAG: DUF3343 domain-containing protein [Oscillospiraceae bacterium]|nr:DUF3343 domain-containing protein [Oscillospiraceae bacterium]